MFKWRKNKGYHQHIKQAMEAWACRWGWKMALAGKKSGLSANKLPGIGKRVFRVVGLGMENPVVPRWRCACQTRLVSLWLAASLILHWGESILGPVVCYNSWNYRFVGLLSNGGGEALAERTLDGR